MLSRFFSKSKKNLLFEKSSVNLPSYKKLEACSSVDRASDSDSERQGFDSLHAYVVHLKYGAVLVSTF